MFHSNWTSVTKIRGVRSRKSSKDFILFFLLYSIMALMTFTLLRRFNKVQPDNGATEEQTRLHVCPNVEDTLCPAKYAIIIPTVKRNTNNYLSMTLNSLLEVDQATEIQTINVVLGSADASHVPAIINNHTKLHLHLMSESEWDSIVDWPIHRKGNHNYLRALTVPLDETDYSEFQYVPSQEARSFIPAPTGCQCNEATRVKGRLVLEDDLIISRKFFHHLMVATALAVLSEYKDKYIFSLYYPTFNGTTKTEINETSMYAFIDEGFCCTQAMFFPEMVVPTIAKGLLQNDINYVRPYDRAMAWQCKDYNLTIITLNRMALVQHIGNVSTGLGKKHQAAVFNIDY